MAHHYRVRPAFALGVAFAEGSLGDTPFRFGRHGRYWLPWGVHNYVVKERGWPVWDIYVQTEVAIRALARHMAKARKTHPGISVKAAEAGIVIVDDLVLAEPKTRLMAKALNQLVGQATALLVIPERNAAYDIVVRSTNNIPDAKVLVAGYLNIRDILSFDKVVLPLGVLDVLKSTLE